MKVNIEKQSDGTYMAYNVDSEKVVLLGSGESVDEAKADFIESVIAFRKSYADRGGEIPAELSETVMFYLVES